MMFLALRCREAEFFTCQKEHMNQNPKIVPSIDKQSLKRMLSPANPYAAGI
jgi:hypothetical protein